MNRKNASETHRTEQECGETRKHEDGKGLQLFLPTVLKCTVDWSCQDEAYNRAVLDELSRPGGQLA